CSESPHTALMDRPPVPRNARIITPFMWTSILATGTFFVAAGLLQIMTGFFGGETPLEIGTIFFTAFVVGQVWNGINCRALDGRMPPLLGNPVFFAVMGIIVAAQFLIVQYGGALFRTVPLSLTTWTMIIAGTASVLILGFLIRAVDLQGKSRRQNPVAGSGKSQE
ncbi:MAG: cation transporting ATPase C-terminal domain-containing protein, partial [Methanothrix sp.]|nr:cation transporting ATPase C-terminal domain-containing protein [Methanothrix sp.]